MLISGAGPIGCFLIQLARMSGQRTLSRSNPIASRHGFASRAGAKVVCNPVEATNGPEGPTRAGAGLT